jgi:predicted GNAT family acetyltransferase
MTNTGKLVFKPSKTKQEIASIYNFNVNAFADMKDFDWSEQNIKKEIADGWQLFSVEFDGDIVAAAFIKESDQALLTKNTPIKMDYQGNGFSHRIKDFYEQYAREHGIKTIVNYCPNDNFRMISLNEGHHYEKTGNFLGKNKEILEWRKTLTK